MIYKPIPYHKTNKKVRNKYIIDYLTPQTSTPLMIRDSVHIYVQLNAFQTIENGGSCTHDTRLAPPLYNDILSHSLPRINQLQLLTHRVSPRFSQAYQWLNSLV